jgi:DMSO reductase family type II enzyme heme b subunit
MKRAILFSIVIINFALGILLGCARQPRQNAEQVVAQYAAEPLPFEDPMSPLWNRAAEHSAALLVQNLTEPALTEPGVPLVKVRALHNGEWVAFRLEWSDATQDLLARAGAGSDAVAIQFPLAGDGDVPASSMGEAGRGVRIWYWKAAWQDDAQRAQAGGGDRISSLYPNAAIDHYPYQAGKEQRGEMEQRYAPARAAGNPVTLPAGGGPVQVLMAEGFGNTRTAPAQTARGKGVWQRGAWITTIARPLRGGAELGDLQAGKRSFVAFAVWDGGKAQTGSRKMRSEWVPLVLAAK